MTGPHDERDPDAEALVHGLLLRLAGSLPDHLLDDARDWLAQGRRSDVARAVAFAALSQPLPLAADEIDLLRSELARGDGGGDLADGLADGLAELSGERIPPSALFVSAVPATDADSAQAVRPQDLSGRHSVQLDPADQALVASASSVPGIRAIWRAWRMPEHARSWSPPVRVCVVSVDNETDCLPALGVRLRRALAKAGDVRAQVEVCWGGLNAPFYQTLARSCGALLWAARPAAAVTTARVFDGVDPMRGPWFAANRPQMSDGAHRERLLSRLRAALIITWCSNNMADVVAPERGDVVPMHLRTDGSWVWSDAVAYYLEHYGLAPDPDLVAHLERPAVEPLDEISLHRTLVHLTQPRPDDVVWTQPWHTKE